MAAASSSRLVCGCSVVGMEQYASGAWREWVRRFNAGRRTVSGRTSVERPHSIEGTTMTEAQCRMRRRVRAVLESLRAVAEEKETGPFAHARRERTCISNQTLAVPGPSFLG
jgi:hypothetical protein